MRRKRVWRAPIPSAIIPHAVAIKVLIILFVAALLYGVYLVAFQSRVSGADAHMLVEQRGAILVDVRTPGEFAQGHLPGARNLPLQEIEKRLEEIGPREKPVVLYCRSGARSLRAVRALRHAGFLEVYNLGPMSAW